MHIPDGFLSAPTCIAAWLFSAGWLGVCMRRASMALKDKMVPLMGVMAAFIFAAQMLNFPVAAGTSGHFLGGLLAAIFLGPYAGAIVIATVLTVQCLIFQDGGLTALGANILNMSFIATACGYAIFRLLTHILGKKGTMASVIIASWFSVVLASSACSLELAVSKTSPFNIVFPTMLAVHALIGIGEQLSHGLFFFRAIRWPELIYKGGVCE